MQKSEQQSRLRFIDFLLHWEGKAQNKQLVAQFGISRQQAWQDLHQYAQLAPANLLPHVQAKPYHASPVFKPVDFTPNIDHYLSWVQQPHSLNDSLIHSDPTTSVSLELPPRQVPALLIRTLVQALRQKQRVEVDYVSLTNPDREGRILTPHTLVNTGLRWHLRGWCEKHQQYRDFVLSRFRGEAELLGPAEQTGSDDTGWHTEVTLILVPDRRLNPEQQAVLEHDYQMQNGQLKLRCRAALAQYLLQQMQVNVKTLDAIPEAQQLELANLNDVKPWLFS
ncbi:MAG: WYL domain-containing protein [Alkalimonas sp.]|nr:WYL domain-containing protein [Alkalimonas sp.]